jgi:hypothetical protein
MNRKIAFTIIVALLSCSFSFGQKLIYKDSIPEIRDVGNYGPNRTHFVYLYLGNNLPVLNQENYRYSISTITPQFGIAYKYKLNENFSSGIRIGYSFRKNEWKSESFRKTYRNNLDFEFLNTAHKFKAFNLSHEALGMIFFRNSPHKAGDRIPKYFEIGAFSYFEMFGKISAIVETDTQGSYTNTIKKRSYYDSHYNHDLKYGINLRTGVGFINLYTNIYLYNIINDRHDPAFIDVGVEINVPII